MEVLVYRAIQDQYNVQVSFRQKQKNFHTTTVVIKVSQKSKMRCTHRYQHVLPDLIGSFDYYMLVLSLNDLFSPIRYEFASLIDAEF